MKDESLKAFSTFTNIAISMFLIGISYILLSSSFQTSAVLQQEVPDYGTSGQIKSIQEPVKGRNGGKILESADNGGTNPSKETDTKEPNESVLIHKGRGPEDTRNKLINYAYKISSGDMKFIGTLEVENYMWSGSRRSIKRGANGYRDRGYCQINQGYHKEIVNNSRFWTDDFWQLDQCWKLYKEGTRFYGKDYYKSVLDRFEIR